MMHKFEAWHGTSLAKMKYRIHILLGITRIDIFVHMHKLEPYHFVIRERALLSKMHPPSKDIHRIGPLRILIVILHRHSHITFNITMFHKHLTVCVHRMVKEKFCRDFLQLFVVSIYIKLLHKCKQYL